MVSFVEMVPGGVQIHPETAHIATVMVPLADTDTFLEELPPSIREHFQNDPRYQLFSTQKEFTLVVAEGESEEGRELWAQIGFHEKNKIETIEYVVFRPGFNPLSGGKGGESIDPEQLAEGRAVSLPGHRGWWRRVSDVGEIVAGIDG